MDMDDIDACVARDPDLAPSGLTRVYDSLEKHAERLTAREAEIFAEACYLAQDH